MKVNGEVCNEMFDDEVDGYLDPPKPPVNEQVKKGRLLLKQYVSILCWFITCAYKTIAISPIFILYCDKNDANLSPRHSRYLSEVGSTDELLNARTARLQIMQSLANSDMMPTFHKPPVSDQSTSPGPDNRLLDRTRNNQGEQMVQDINKQPVDWSYKNYLKSFFGPFLRLCFLCNMYSGHL